MTDGSDGVAISPPPKVDPETLAIRARPQRAIRFKRGLIIGIAAIGSASLITIAWVALKPPVFHQMSEQGDQSDQIAVRPSEMLNSLPGSYGDVPRLGPPLPGDLGRPILNRQRELAGEEQAAGDAQGSLVAERQQRQLAEIRAARQSPVLVQSGRAATDAGSSRTEPFAPPLIPQDSRPMDLAVDLDSRQGGAGRARPVEHGETVNPYRIMPAASPYVLSAGSVIAASLVTGLNSDLPGLVIAQVTDNVFDMVTGRILLIPQGARLIGRYDHQVAVGQDRIHLIWQRLILPDGSSLQMGEMPAADTEGYAGLTDRVDRHGWRLLQGVALSTALGIGTELTYGRDETGLVRATREAAQAGGAGAGDQLVARNIDVRPTLKVRPGWPMRLIVHKDLVLRPWHEAGTGPWN